MPHRIIEEVTMNRTAIAILSLTALVLFSPALRADDAAAPADAETECIKKCYTDKKACMDEVQDIKKKTPGQVGRMRYKTKTCNSTFAQCRNECKSKKAK